MKSAGSGALTAVALSSLVAVVLVFSRSAALEAIYPAEKARVAFTSKVWTRISGFFRGAEACAENVRLRREVASLSLLNSELERLDEENSRLRKALDYAERNPGQWLPARVLSRNGGAAGAHDSIRVDKGSLHGVVEGAAVVVPDGLVGRVDSVSPHTSSIVLVTDRSLKIACEIESQSQPYPKGFVVGGSEESLIVDYLDKRDILPRSRVLTSGIAGKIPKGVAIGIYIGEGKVQPAVEYSSLEDVFIRREK